MLAYVFWHTPHASVDPNLYEATLLSFHQSLDPTEVDGFHESAVFRIEGAPWMSGPNVYEDWYLVRDLGALGSLNVAAVADRRQAPHDTLARLTGKGAAGVYALRRGLEVLCDAGQAAWFAKPVGTSYNEVVNMAEGIGQLWQRQLVLGPTPELCLLAGEAPSDAIVVKRTSVR